MSNLIERLKSAADALRGKSKENPQDYAYHGYGDTGQLWRSPRKPVIPERSQYERHS